MITAQKIKRELARPFKQFDYYVGWLARRTAGTLRRIHYDAHRRDSVHVSEGKRQARDEIAIFLIYQPNGVAGSIFFTLSHLLDHGISPVIVSNLRLSRSDRDRLSELCWLVIDRPNIGYDFGGYREGILTVLERGARPKALYVMNDSIWFPLRESCDIINKCRSADADIFGIQIDRWGGRRKIKFVHSYFFRFSGRLASSRDFIAYWRKLKLLRNKWDIIKYCEIGLTRHFLRRGFSANGVGSPSKLGRLVLETDDEEWVRAIVLYQYNNSRKEQKYLHKIVEDGIYTQTIRKQLKTLIEQRVIFRQMLFLHPWVYQKLGLDYVKKARYPSLDSQRATILKLGLHQGYHPIIRRELEQLGES